MATKSIRKFVYRNPSSGKVYEIVFKRAADGSASFVGKLLGTGKVNSDPSYDNTEVTGVVLTSAVSAVFKNARKSASASCYQDAYLAAAAIYDASNPAAGGALLSTIAV